MPKTRQRLRGLTTECIGVIREYVEALRAKRDEVPRIPYGGANVSQASYARQQEHLEREVFPIVEMLIAQFERLQGAFGEIEAFLRSGDHGKGSKDELRAHYGAMIGFARDLGAMIEDFFSGELSDQRRAPRVAALFALLEDLPEAIPGTD